MLGAEPGFPGLPIAEDDHELSHARHGSLALVGAILAVSALCAGAGQVDPDPWQGYSFFFGNLHSHTSSRRVLRRPPTPFIVARDAADVDSSQ